MHDKLSNIYNNMLNNLKLQKKKIEKYQLNIYIVSCLDHSSDDVIKYSEMIAVLDTF